MAGREQRSECRYVADSECTLRYKIEKQVVEATGLVTDLSVRGIRVAVSCEMPPRTLAIVTIHDVPDHPIYGQLVHTAQDTGKYRRRLGMRVVDGVLPFHIFRQLIRDAVEWEVAEEKPKAPETPTCFRRLGISFPATKKEIDHAFRELAMKVHPDRGGNVTDFVAIHTAYQEALKLAV